MGRIGIQLESSRQQRAEEIPIALLRDAEPQHIAVDGCEYLMDGVEMPADDIGAFRVLVSMSVSGY